MRTRTRTTSHGEPLRWSTDSAKIISETFQSLTKFVFSTHFYNSYPRNALDLLHKAQSTPDRLTESFYQSCYSPTPLLPKNPRVSSTPLEEIVFHTGNYEQTENQAWITGRVGMGKSSSVCNWLHANRMKILAEKRIFIRIDIDKKLPQTDSPHIEQLPTKDEFIYSILEKIREAVKDHFGTNGSYTLFNTEFKQIDSSDPDSIRDACLLVGTIYEHYVTLILDNLDYLVYTHDRYLFCDDYQAGEMASFERRVREYLDCFANRRMVLVAGFSLIVVSRDTSQAWLRRCDVKDRVITATRHEFIIHEAGPFQVVEAHYKLMALAADERRDNRSKRIANTAKQEFNKRLRTEPAYSEDLQNALLLAGNGLRGIVELSNFLLIPLGGEFLRDYHPDFVAATRIVDHEYLIPQTVMLSFRARYSQRDCDFPNLFLINSQRRPKDSNKIGSHRVTYWLKIFLLLYIKEWDDCRLSNNSSPSTASLELFCNVAKIESVFCEGDNSYSSSLVRVAIGSMFSTAGSGLITSDTSVDRSNEDKVRELPLRLTTRAEVLLQELEDFPIKNYERPKSRRAYDFRYLELITEDYELPIPDKLFGRFKYEEVTYAYFCQYEDVRVNLAKMRLWKGKLVSIMYAFLAKALKEEYLLYSDVTERLIEQKIIRGDGSCFQAAVEHAVTKGFVNRLSPELEKLISDEVCRIYALEKFRILGTVPDGKIPNT